MTEIDATGKIYSSSVPGNCVTVLPLVIPLSVSTIREIEQEKRKI